MRSVTSRSRATATHAVPPTGPARRGSPPRERPSARRPGSGAPPPRRTGRLQPGARSRTPGAQMPAGAPAEPQRRSSSPTRRANVRHSGSSSGRNGCVAGPPSSSTTPASRSERSTGDRRGATVYSQRRRGPRSRRVLVAREARSCRSPRPGRARGAQLPQRRPVRAARAAVRVVQLRGQHGRDAEREDVTVGPRPPAASSSATSRYVAATHAWCSHSSPTGHTPWCGSQGRWECRTRQRAPGTGERSPRSSPRVGVGGHEGDDGTDRGGGGRCPGDDRGRGGRRRGVPAVTPVRPRHRGYRWVTSARRATPHRVPAGGEPVLQGWPDPRNHPNLRKRTRES